MDRCRHAPARLARLALCAAVATVLFGAPAAEAASLKPTRSGLLRQSRAAKSHGYSYLRNDSQVRDFARKGYLVRLPGNSNYVVKGGMRHPYARPEVKLFIERLSDQYKDACGKNLVVTSLVRPKNRQPKRSSSLSVHPTGMAMDLRVSKYPRCRAWLERALLNLERAGVLEAARERYPPHYHVVLFPDPYVRYVERKSGRTVPASYRTPRARRSNVQTVSSTTSSRGTYRVRRGDSLWEIARRHGTSVSSLRRANGLRSSRIRPGQVLRVP